MCIKADFKNSFKMLNGFYSVLFFPYARIFDVVERFDRWKQENRREQREPRPTTIDWGLQSPFFFTFHPSQLWERGIFISTLSLFSMVNNPWIKYLRLNNFYDFMSVISVSISCSLGRRVAQEPHIFPVLSLKTVPYFGLCGSRKSRPSRKAVIGVLLSHARKRFVSQA